MGTVKLLKNIARGIKALDKHCPGWIDLIDTTRLEWGSSEKCVIGQLASRYGEEYRTILSDVTKNYQLAPWSCGFDYDGFEGPSVNEEKLTKLWKLAIKIRRGRQ